jgi:hypothetical protein
VAAGIDPSDVHDLRLHRAQKDGHCGHCRTGRNQWCNDCSHRLRAGEFGPTACGLGSALVVARVVDARCGVTWSGDPLAPGRAPRPCTARAAGPSARAR